MSELLLETANALLLGITLAAGILALSGMIALVAAHGHGFPFVHRWRSMVWGGDQRLTCRECRWCNRFEVYAYWSYHKADRAKFPDARPA